MDNTEFVQEIAKLRPGSTFLVLHRYQNEHGELADYNIVFNISYANALRRSIAVVNAFVPADDLQERAKLEVLTSYQESLHRVETTDINDVDDAYIRYFDENNRLINGIKLHISSNVLHMFGLIHLKRVIIPGTYKKVNSRPITIEKRKIQYKCPVSKFRQFRLHPSQLERIKVQNISLLPPEDNN